MMVATMLTVVAGRSLEATLRLAKEGQADAQTQLGEIYLWGKQGMKKDHAKAKEWFHKAAKQGSANAQYFMGSLYNQGWGVKKDPSKAAAWTEKAANGGHVEAQFYLGEMYFHATGVEENHEKAFEWYEKSAKQGDAPAQSNVGRMLYFGDGVEKDYAEAFKWTKESAENVPPDGYLQSFEILAMLYERGHGVQQSNGEAIKWYKKALNKGAMVKPYLDELLKEENRHDEIRDFGFEYEEDEEEYGAFEDEDYLNEL